MPEPCPFCDPDPEGILVSNNLCYALFDRYPVTPGHLLVIPFRHFSDYFAGTSRETAALDDLLRQCRRILEETHHPDGYNIGVNVGNAAGQSVPHVHVHVIPRYRGDTPSPRGGIRGVIPGKQDY